MQSAGGKTLPGGPAGKTLPPSALLRRLKALMDRLSTFPMLALLTAGVPLLADDWPAWRGPTGLGVSSEKNLPLRWSASENVKWKVPLPAPGNSTPIIWGSRVYLTQAIDGGKKRMLLALDRKDGRIVWQTTVEYAEPEPTHEDSPYASASPVTDGERIVVSYGSAGVFAYDFEGKELWRRDLGKFHHVWGNAASPVLHGDLCFLNGGPGPRTSLTALDKKTGKTAWQVEIPGGLADGDSKTWTGSWSTPLALRAAGREELVVSFPHRLLAFDPATGREIWSCAGLGRLVYTSPIAADGVVVAMSGFMGPPLAVRAGGEGDVTATRRLWHEEKAQQRIGSGIISEGHIFIVNDTGVAQCLELLTGKEIWRERLGASAWGSLVLADGKLHIADQEGETHVFRPVTKFERLAANPLGERTRASIAVSAGEIFIRTYKQLWCIAEKR